MNDPLFSIVTPSLNPGSRLSRCLASVAAQTYSRIEHLVIDGGSTDGTADLLKKSEGLRWISEPDAGQSDAINKGFALAQGDYLGWLNADDVLTPWAVQRTAEAFSNHPTAGWSVGDVIVESEEGAELEGPARIERASAWRARNLAAQPGSFTSRWALERVGGLDPSFHLMMDLELWLRLVEAGIDHVYVRHVLAVFELHEDSKSGSIPHSEFLLEDGRARAKSGRLDEAAFAFGRSAAWAGASDPSEWLQERVGDWLSQLDARFIDQGLRTERAVIRAKATRTGFIRAADPRLWMSSFPRSRLLHAAGREFSRGRRRRAAASVLERLRATPT